jgi:hypothetical protein
MGVIAGTCVIRLCAQQVFAQSRSRIDGAHLDRLPRAITILCASLCGRCNNLQYCLARRESLRGLEISTMENACWGCVTPVDNLILPLKTHSGVIK